MPRRLRNATGGYVYHVLNRAVGRMTLFESDGDYAAFLRTLADVQDRPPLAGKSLRARAEPPQHRPLRVLALCLMPNHFHLLLWPRQDGELSNFMRLLTVTHTQRWHAAHRTAGTGPLYQGRFKSFPVQRDSALLSVARYIERNAVRAGLEHQPGLQWPWSSAAIRRAAETHANIHTAPAETAAANAAAAFTSEVHRAASQLPAWLLPPEDWPAELPRDATRPEAPRGVSAWEHYLQNDGGETEQAAIRHAIRRSSPLGSDRWVKQTAARLGLGSTLRPRGRPKVGKGST